MKEVFSQSKLFKKEYCCEIVRIGKIVPIENSEFLAKTEIYPGMPIVVRKDEIQEGEIMFYVSLECRICDDFLKINNQYSDSNLNENREEKGFFDKHGRVRLIKLRGQESMGYLFDFNDMNKYLKKVFGIRLSEDKDSLVGIMFDEVCNQNFVKAYIPETKTQTGSKRHEKRRAKKLNQFDRIIPGEFSFHYDTEQLERSIKRILPNEIVDISVKLHGTSAIFANVLTKKYVPWYKKPAQWLGLIETSEYSNVYSSRSVIKNRDINKKVTGGFYNEDIWGIWNEHLKDFIEKGITIYGEIVGYTPTGQAIQKVGKQVYDYGCRPCESKLMIYRVTEDAEGGKKEYTIPEVIEYTADLISRMKTAGAGYYINIMKLPLLYSGALQDRYPNIPRDDEWYTNVLHALANDSEFKMEQNEPLCYNTVPREGFVLRKRGDYLKEAFKLKTMKFRQKEALAIDEGQVDLEMEETNY